MSSDLTIASPSQEIVLKSSEDNEWVSQEDSWSLTALDLCAQRQPIIKSWAGKENRQKVITRPQKPSGGTPAGRGQTITIPRHLPPHHIAAWHNLTPTTITLHNSWTTKHRLKRWRQQHIAPRRGLLLELIAGQLQRVARGPFDH